MLHNFLEPTFADSRYYETLEPSDGADRGRAARPARCSALAGIALAYQLWVAQARGAGARCARGSPPLHRFFVAQVVLRRGSSTSLVVRPFAWFGRFGRNTFERRRDQRRVHGRHDRRRCAPARPPCARSQSGYLRYYAALLLLGLTGLGLYFLVAGD